MIKLKILDLFSGIGGFSLGLERTGGFETVAFCEFDKKARLVLNKHWPDVPMFDDVRTLIKEKLDEQGISVDVICGGFPCQDISLAGKGAGLDGERSGLWWEFHRLIKEIRPQWAIIENVSALRSRGLDAVLRSLVEIGYDAEWHCIPASAVGAPHQRDRIWIIAYPDSEYRRAKSSSSDSAEGRAWIELGGLRPNVADTKGWNVRDDSEDLWSLGGEINASVNTSRSGGRDDQPKNWKIVADANNTGLQRWQEAKNFGSLGTWIQQFFERRSDNIGATWAVEPDVGRVAYGIPKRVDRLKQLGNAVVPQIPELIGYAILENIKNGTP